MYKITEVREHEVLRLEFRMQNDPGPDHVGPYMTPMSSGLCPNVFEQRDNVISFRLLEDDPGEGRDLIGG